MASLRTRTVSGSSIPHTGADNAETLPNGIGPKGQENPLELGATRGSRVLGDIGNRLRKNLVTGQQGPTGKPTVAMKPSIKPSVAPLKATEHFAVPRAPRGGVTNRQENVRPQITRSNSVIVQPQKKVNNATKPDVGIKVLGSLQNRSQSHSNLKDILVKPVATTVSGDDSKPPPGKTLIQKEIPGRNLKISEVTVQESKPINQIPSSASEEAPTNADIQETEPTKTDCDAKDQTKIKDNIVAVPSIQVPEVFDIDSIDGNNPLLLREYIQDICDYMFTLEKKYPIRIRYLEGRLVNSKMRAVLLDWLVEVHYQFGFMPETLYMASKTMDRYLQKERKVTRKQLQLVGVTAMYIAAKFEEVCTPTVVDFSAVSDNAFSASEVRQMEREILQSLEYDLAPPPAVFFLRRFSKAAGVSNGRAPMMVHTMAKYIMEHTLVDYGTCHLYPSEQAAASLALSLLIIDKSKTLKEHWTPTLQHFTRTPIDSLKRILTPVASLIAKVHEEPPKLKAVFNKYGRNRLSKVSLIPELQIKEWKERVVKDLC